MPKTVSQLKQDYKEITILKKPDTEIEFVTRREDLARFHADAHSLICEGSEKIEKLTDDLKTYTEVALSDTMKSLEQVLGDLSDVRKGKDTKEPVSVRRDRSKQRMADLSENVAAYEANVKRLKSERAEIEELITQITFLEEQNALDFQKFKEKERSDLAAYSMFQPPAAIAPRIRQKPDMSPSFACTGMCTIS